MNVVRLAEEESSAMRYWLKKCPRCRQGDLLEDRDRYGRYLACVQCGYILNAAEQEFLFGVMGLRAPNRGDRMAA